MSEVQRNGKSQRVLRLQGVTKAFGGVCAVDHVSFDVHSGHLVGLVGPNGAGKSTLLAAISGHLRHDDGRIELHGEDTSAWPAHVRARQGVRRTFQVSRLMPELSVIDNVKLGRLGSQRVDLARALLTVRRSITSDAQLGMDARSALERVGLADKAMAPALALSYGEVRLAELARAIVGEPEILLLDEPAAGLNASEAARLGDVLLELLAGCHTKAILLVEHNLPLVLKIASHMCVLNFGRLLASGVPAEVVRDRSVREAYTGG